MVTATLRTTSKGRRRRRGKGTVGYGVKIAEEWVVGRQLDWEDSACFSLSDKFLRHSLPIWVAPHRPLILSPPDS